MSSKGKAELNVGGERLQRFLARAGVASRRAGETLISQGRVEVNGETVTELGRRVQPTDDVRLDGERVRPPDSNYVLLLHKPAGVLCSRDDPAHRPLVYALLPPDTTLRSVGRLDFHTEGVLLFTNDGDLADRLAHPRHGVERVYEARVRGVPTAETLARLVRGVILDDGPARVISIEIFKQTEKNAWVRVTLQEGRNREVRRILERVGHPVMRLRRVRFAGLGLDGLRQGAWRVLEAAEVEALALRGHVGSFGLPPDPRRRGVQAAGVAQAAAAPRKRELAPRRRDDEKAGAVADVRQGRGRRGTPAPPERVPAGSRGRAAGKAVSAGSRPGRGGATAAGAGAGAGKPGRSVPAKRPGGGKRKP